MYTHILDLNASRVLQLHPPFAIIVSTILRPLLKHLRNSRVIKDWSSFVLTWLHRHKEPSLPCAAPFFHPHTSSLGGGMGIPPHPSALLLANTSLVTRFPLHSWGKYTIKKDLCCPLSPISPPNATEPRERSWHFRETREAAVTLERHQALKWRWLERADQRPRADGAYPWHRTKPELKTTSNQDFLLSTGLNLGKRPTEFQL